MIKKTEIHFQAQKNGKFLTHTKHCLQIMKLTKSRPAVKSTDRPTK